MNKKRGSALIIAVLLIASVGAIAFGIGKLLFLEVGTEQIYDNGSYAFYAAESGIEEGLLRYRIDQKAEAQVPTANWSLFDPTKVFRTDLLDASMVTTNTSGDLITNSISNPAKQYYDLRMGYLGTDGNFWYGHHFNANGNYLSTPDLENSNYATGNYSVLNIPQDDALKIDLTGVDLRPANSSQLMTEFSFSDGSLVNNCNALLEATLTVDNISGIHQYKDTFGSSSCTSGQLGVDVNKIVSQNYQFNNNKYYMEIANLGDIFNRAGAPLPSGSDSGVLLTLKPLYTGTIPLGSGFNAAIGLCDNADGSCGTSAIPGPFTTITSTGYYGGVTRKLTANVDRQSGTLYDLFDYVINKN